MTHYIIWHFTIHKALQPILFHPPPSLFTGPHNFPHIEEVSKRLNNVTKSTKLKNIYSQNCNQGFTA